MAKSLSIKSTILSSYPVSLRQRTYTSDHRRNELHQRADRASSSLSGLSCRNSAVEVAHEMHMTTVNAKVCNGLTDTASNLRCYVRKATSRELNDLQSMRQREAGPETFEFGLSVKENTV